MFTLQLIVGPNSLPEVSRGLKNSSYKSHMLTTVDNIMTGVREAGYPIGVTERGKYFCEKSLNILNMHSDSRPNSPYSIHEIDLLLSLPFFLL
jgi:hypothetical protein